MKRYIAMIMAMCMMFTMAGCSNAKDLFPKNTKKDGKEKVQKVDESGMKIGYLFPSAQDAIDTESRMEGIRQMQYETSLTDSQILVKTSVDKDAAAAELDSLAEAGCDLIFACGRMYEAAVLEAAEKYPEIQFCQEGGKKAKKSGLSNMHNYYVRLYEGYYVSGIAAGMKINELLNSGRISSSNCTVGFVVNEKSAVTTSCINAFYLGIEEVCSQASVLVRYTDSKGVYDDDGEEARQLAAAGVGFMSQLTSTTAVPVVCAENDIPLVGSWLNAIDSAPSEALTSVAVNWDVYYSYAVDCLLEGEKIDTDWSGGYEEGAVTLTQLNDPHLASGTVERLKDAEKDIRRGKKKIFNLEKFTVEGQSLDTISKEKKSYKKYKKYIADGEFRESRKRSAPVMEFFVDGVEKSTYDFL